MQSGIFHRLCQIGGQRALELQRLARDRVRQREPVRVQRLALQPQQRTPAIGGVADQRIKSSYHFSKHSQHA